MIDVERLERRFQAGEGEVGVLGLGYAGLPLAIAFAESGFRVLGIDQDPEKVDCLLAGGSYIDTIAAERVQALLADGRFSASTDTTRLREPDAVAICLPTPLADDRTPDLSYIEKSGEALVATLRPGQLVVLESTTYPGTTREVLRPILESRGLHAGSDFFLAYSPEREDPGNPDHTLTHVPKVVGADDPMSRRLVAALYQRLVPRLVKVSSCAAAEATKLTENIYRAVNIALVNELKMVFTAMGIDVWEVLAAAATKPFGFQRFDPGPGWGGHCIPIDPFYLSWRAERDGTSARFVELAGRINTEMPGWVVDRLIENLGERPIKGSRVLLLGVAYKADVDDTRESPAFVLFNRLRELGAEVEYHDPHVPVLPAMRSWPELENLQSVPLEAERLADTDAVLVVTAHRAIDFEHVARHASLVLDTRGVFAADTPHVVRA